MSLRGFQHYKDAQASMREYEPVDTRFSAFEFKITTMKCDSCVGAIKERIESMPGIHQVEVNLQLGAARVVAHYGFDPEEICKAVRTMDWPWQHQITVHNQQTITAQVPGTTSSIRPSF